MDPIEKRLSRRENAIALPFSTISIAREGKRERERERIEKTKTKEEKKVDPKYLHQEEEEIIRFR